MHYSYSFDFGPAPCFIIDGWFLRTIGPVLLLSALLLPLSQLSSFWLNRYVLPAVALGAVTIFIGIYLYRRAVAQRRVAQLDETVFHYTIDTEGFHFTNPLGSGVVRWGFRTKLIPRRNFILLQSSEVGLLPLPADTPEEVVAFVHKQLDAAQRRRR